MADYTRIFASLYDNVLKSEQWKHSVSFEKVQAAIRGLESLYMPNPEWEMLTCMYNANYNTPAYRLGYLHKYAPFYTGLVYDVLVSAFERNGALQRIIHSKRQLNVCCLGGGPGTDVVAVLAALFECFGFMPCFVTMLDEAENWNTVFETIIRELWTGWYGNIKHMVSAPCFGYEYLTADLLKEVESNFEVYDRIKSADVLTMVKFISAVACNSTRKMVETIFKCMKPGAILIFIDNAGGGFDMMMKTVAMNCNMNCVYGPLDHFDYENSGFSVTRFGYASQSKTKVAIQIWRKDPPHTLPSLNYPAEHFRNEFDFVRNDILRKFFHEMAQRRIGRGFPLSYQRPPWFY